MHRFVMMRCVASIRLPFARPTSGPLQGSASRSAGLSATFVEFSRVVKRDDSCTSVPDELVDERDWHRQRLLPS